MTHPSHTSLSALICLTAAVPAPHLGLSNALSLCFKERNEGTKEAKREISRELVTLFLFSGETVEWVEENLFEENCFCLDRYMSNRWCHPKCWSWMNGALHWVHKQKLCVNQGHGRPDRRRVGVWQNWLFENLQCMFRQAWKPCWCSLSHSDCLRFTYANEPRQILLLCQHST